MWKLLAWGAVAIGCGPGLKAEDPKTGATNALEVASGDEHAIRRLLGAEMTYAGLWFADAGCTAEFPVAGVIRAEKLDALAHCLAGLRWHQAARRDPLADVVVLTYPPGIEIEARMVAGDDGPHIAWIGYSSRRDTPSALPSVAPEVFDALRTAGDPNGPIDPATASTLELDADADVHAAYAWFQVCLDADGNVTGAHLRKVTSQKAAQAFTDAASRWKFQPFTVGGRAIPVCSLLKMSYPPGATAAETLPLPLPPSQTVHDEVMPMEVPPKAVEARRIAGEKLITPDDHTKTAIQKAGPRRVVATFRLCLDRAGHPEAIDLLRSTGYPRYDLKLATAMRHWLYSPFLIADQPVPVCTGITFIYTQR